MALIETTIQTSGGDYTSLSGAEADDFGCGGGDTFLCEYAESMSDTTAVVVTTVYAGEISAQSGYRHLGDVSSGAVLAPSSGSYGLDIQSPNVDVSHLRIDCTNLTVAGMYVHTDGSNDVSYLFIHNIQEGDNGIRVNDLSGGTTTVVGYRIITSCQASAGTDYGHYVLSGSDVTLYFCTSYAKYAAFRNLATFATYGCVGFSQYPWYGTFSGDYNADNYASSTYQAPGANSAHNLTPADELTDPASDDFTIKSGGTGTLIDLVATDAYNAYFPDIAGNSESGSHPDCGAFEVAGAPPASTGIHNPLHRPFTGCLGGPL